MTVLEPSWILLCVHLILCQMDKPCMSSQNAVSWGYFDVDNMTWELDL